MAPPAPAVRAWIWKLLHAEYAPRMGADAWAALEADVGAAGVRALPHDRLVPAGPFADALRRLDARFARGDDSETVEAGRRVAHRWGTLYRTLVDGLRGKPETLLRLFTAEVHPYWVGDTGSGQLLESDAYGALVRLDDAMPDGFRRGLLQGAVELADARADVRRVGPATYRVEWRVAAVPSRPGLVHLLRACVRPPFVAATLVPVLVGLAIAAGHGPPHVLGGLLTALGVVLFQVGSNAMNDYYDHVSGADRPTARAGLEEQRALRRAQAQPERLRTLAFALYAMGALVGLFLVATRGIEILWLGLAGFLLGFLYSAPPVRLAHRGLGELSIAVGFGPLIVLGTYFVQRQAWSLEALFASIPVAFLMALVLYIHEFPDRDGDARVGKRTLIVRLPERPAVIGYVVLLALTYLIILGGVALRGVPDWGRYAFPPWSLLGLLTFPLAARTAVFLARNYRFPYRLVPDNANAIRLHVTTGLLFAAGYVIALLP